MNIRRWICVLSGGKITSVTISFEKHSSGKSLEKGHVDLRYEGQDALPKDVMRQNKRLMRLKMENV